MLPPTLDGGRKIRSGSGLSSGTSCSKRVCGSQEGTEHALRKPLGEPSWRPPALPGREYQNRASQERQGLPCLSDDVSSTSSVRKL